MQGPRGHCRRTGEARTRGEGGGNGSRARTAPDAFKAQADEFKSCLPPSRELADGRDRFCEALGRSPWSCLPWHLSHSQPPHSASPPVHTFGEGMRGQRVGIADLSHHVVSGQASPKVTNYGPITQWFSPCDAGVGRQDPWQGMNAVGFGGRQYLNLGLTRTCTLYPTWRECPLGLSQRGPYHENIYESTQSPRSKQCSCSQRDHQQFLSLLPRPRRTRL